MKWIYLRALKSNLELAAEKEKRIGESGMNHPLGKMSLHPYQHKHKQNESCDLK